MGIGGWLCGREGLAGAFPGEEEVCLHRSCQRPHDQPRGESVWPGARQLGAGAHKEGVHGAHPGSLDQSQEPWRRDAVPSDSPRAS